ncbi:MAG: methionine biosynthesis protein MetW [Arenicellales bacterium]|jgi:methionine biosynthesis protein MetW|nr:methionine biosynthesis protein MetW [Arenicellales bacterium]MDP6672071.1 methionine biosynthesis protein MetW [Arenicellales bacterium]MDP6724927.1 methionine biosynthesis protein MetW [Arenicellales bacterium]|tara:strand:- start:17547 stop:18194 length:648 start_codon:yes stop_codon:yes gene_type:complete
MNTPTDTATTLALRSDLQIIAEWIQPGNHILDLGCGDGSLMGYLARTKSVTGYGIEIEDHYIPQCIRNGVNVLQMDLDRGLTEFSDNSFDQVILSMALQTMHYPHLLMKEMLRVGREGIITFPNFGHWKVRWYLAGRGRMPVSEALPNYWYNTPNIHLCTLQDFEELCRQHNFQIQERRTLNHHHETGLGLRLLPNLLGEIVLYRFTRLPDNIPR